MASGNLVGSSDMMSPGATKSVNPELRFGCLGTYEESNHLLSLIQPFGAIKEIGQMY